ncbi:MAG: efflux RND transporter periplasmic adaptor subunit [Pseudomonadales bacterium]
MRSTYLTALIIAALVIAWLVSGQLSEDPPSPADTIAEQNRNVALLGEEKPPVAVRVATSYSQVQARELKIRGETHSRRQVEVKAQIGGTVVERVVERGDRVAQGDRLCRISAEDRLVAMEEAKQALAQAKIEYEGSQRLAKEGLQSQTLIAQSRARLAAAEANYKRSQLDVERLNIRAPFDGLIESVPLELGDLVTPGVTCATLVALDPMLLAGRISELEISGVSVGQTGKARLSSGEIVEGTVSFIGKVADPATRTYAIELETENSDYRIASGLTAEITIPVRQIQAHKISPALLTLDDVGNIGVRTMNSENEVEFYLVDIVRQDENGLWVSGLPQVTTLITVGQELVVAGEVVEPTFEDLETAQPGAAVTDPVQAAAAEVKSS